MPAEPGFVIDPRFNGPHDSGNGGYVSGRLAAAVDSESVVVRLSAPPPLDTPLEIRTSGAGAELLHGDVVLATARPGELTIEPPPLPSAAQVAAASKEFRGFEDHPHPRCFVCGHERGAGDGLRIFPGPVAGESIVAAPWVPDASLALNGSVAPEFIWAALDCPGGFSFNFSDGGVILLGEIHVELRDEVVVGERCTILGWELGHEGRKHFTGTALFGSSGECLGVSRATWIELAAQK